MGQAQASSFAYDRRLIAARPLDRGPRVRALAADVEADRLRRALFLAVPLSSLLWILMAAGLMSVFR